MKRRHYVNLTNGVGFFQNLGFKADVFMRLSSTDCEQKRWWRVIDSIPDDLLLHAALGFQCVVFDAGHDGEPRALWQGLQLFAHCLAREWRMPLPRPDGRCATALQYFGEQHRWLKQHHPATLRRLQHYRRYLDRDATPTIVRAWSRTRMDGDYGQARCILYRYVRGDE